MESTIAVEAVLFDRDGTLIDDVPYNGNPELVQPVDGAIECVRRLREAGLKTGIISNQSGIARGLITRLQVEQVNRRVEEIFGPFDICLYCPHGPEDGCDCRKPMPGLVIEGAALLATQASRCVVVGDKQSDVDAALAAGAKAFLVTSPAAMFDVLPYIMTLVSMK